MLKVISEVFLSQLVLAVLRDPENNVSSCAFTAGGGSKSIVTDII